MGILQQISSPELLLVITYCQQSEMLIQRQKQQYNIAELKKNPYRLKML